MVSATHTSLSGLTAAARRVEVAASNLANQNSTRTRVDGETADTPYVPQRVDQISLSNAGVRAQVKAVEPATVTQPDANAPDGLVEAPNTDPAREISAMKLAAYDYRANIRAIQVQNRTENSLLDILS